MWIRRLQIENFRGIQKCTVDFSERQTILVGTTGVGKSTVFEALALLFGRDRLVRTLTEHDFFGSNPKAEDRMRLVATVTGFSPNLPSQHTILGSLSAAAFLSGGTTHQRSYSRNRNRSWMH